MPNVKFRMNMDNRVKPGLTTRSEVLANLRANGIDVQAADPVFDAVTGKLIRVDVMLPDTASQTAKDAIDANPGVSGTVIPIPEPLFVFDLENMVLATHVLEVGTFNDQIQFAVTSDGLAFRTSLGTLSNPSGAGNVYADGSTNVNGRPFAIAILVARSAGWTLPPSDLTITYDGGKTLALANQSPIAITKLAGFLGSQTYYIATDGKMYLGRSDIDASLIAPRTFDEAVAAGAA